MRRRRGLFKKVVRVINRNHHHHHHHHHRCHLQLLEEVEIRNFQGIAMRLLRSAQLANEQGIVPAVPW
jgi:hypothetical protein